MEFIVLTVALVMLVLLDVLAIRFGHDSRDGLRTKEHELAMHGLTWDEITPDSVAPRGRVGRTTCCSASQFVEQGQRENCGNCLVEMAPTNGECRDVSIPDARND